MKTSIKLTLTFGLLLTAVCLSGCATQCGSCQDGRLFGGRLFQDQPVRSTIRSWFQGDNCDTCNAPAGQVYSPNVAPLCDTCNTGQPVGSAVAPLYGGYANPADVQLQAPQLNSTQLGPETPQGF